MWANHDRWVVDMIEPTVVQAILLLEGPEIQGYCRPCHSREQERQGGMVGGLETGAGPGRVPHNTLS